MAEMTLAEAAAWAKVSKPSVLKQIQKGRISAVKNEAGEYRIDPAEVERVYGEHRQRAVAKAVAGTELEPQAESVALAASKDREIALLTDALNDARKQRDEAQQREQVTLALLRDLPRMIAHQPQPPETPAPEKPRLSIGATQQPGVKLFGFTISRGKGGK